MNTDNEAIENEDYYADDVSTFGDRVAAAREALGLDQKGLASKLGVKNKTIAAWEEDRAEPRANKLQMLAGILNVSIMWLMNGTGPGLERPVLSGEGETAAAAELLAEMRAIRAEHSALTARMLRFEKQLRGLLET